MIDPRSRFLPPLRGPSAGRRRAAFTLLEVLLSMVLLVVLISVVAGTIDFHLKQLTMRKTRIEESQLARVVLRRIADDLRAVAVSRPIDVQQATADAVSGTAGAMGGAMAGATAGVTSGGGAADSSGASTGDAATSDAAASVAGDTATTTPAGPGLYGTAYQLQLDVGRLPRFEEYSLLAAQAQTTALGLASDVRTVTYYLAEPSARGANPGSVAESTSDMMSSRYGIGLYDGGDGMGGGLVRRAVDRAIERYAMETSDYSMVNAQVDVLAPEVVQLQFQYFDGTQWLSEWDSDQMGGVPLAVEVAVQIDAGRTDERVARKREAGVLSAADATVPRIYRLVVQLPAAEPLTDGATAGEATSEPAEDASSSSSGSGTTGAAP